VAQRAAADVRLGDLVDAQRDCTRDSTPARRSASCSASAFMSVASMPM
jgi:hypothetical protein